MDQKQVFKQVIEFQKGTFDNAFNAMVKLQEQGEAMLNGFLAQSPWIPEDGKKVVVEWMDAYKKARIEFKDTVDGNFEKVREFFDGKQADE